MKIKFRHFPHPVLADFSDYFAEGRFLTDISIDKLKDNSYSLEVSANVTVPEIKNLIDIKEAKFCVHTECPLTHYRHVMSSFESEFSFIVPAEVVDGKVEVVTFILAEKNITSYFCEGFEPFLQNYNFSIKKGDILAIGKQLSFLAEKNIDSIKNITSIFSVRALEEEEPPALDMEANSEQIIIWLPPKMFEKYSVLKNNSDLHPILGSIIVIPILTEIIQEIKESGSVGLDGYEQRRWFKVLTKRLKEIGINYENKGDFNESATAVAQELIGRILEDAFEKIEKREEALL